MRFLSGVSTSNCLGSRELLSTPKTTRAVARARGIVPWAFLPFWNSCEHDTAQQSTAHGQVVATGVHERRVADWQWVVVVVVVVVVLLC